MPFGITNVTAVNLSELTAIANQSSLPNLFVAINNDIYGGFLFFILLWVLWIILFFAANQTNNQILQNAMYSGAVVSLASFFLRVIEMRRAGVVEGLLSDYFMWIFPLITILIALVLWMTKDA